MNVQTLGKLTAYERNKNQISLQVLAEGLCSVSALQRLEGGERLLDFFVVERLLERLGTSINKMEFLFTETEYELYYLRELIEKELVQNNYSEVEKALEYYQSKPETDEALHRQYICKVWAVIEGKEKRNHAKAQHLLEEAMRLTMPWLEVSDVFPVSAMEKYLLGEGELLLFLMWLEERMAQDASCLRIDGKRILNYIERICKDEEARVNVYSKAAWVLGTLAILQNNLPEALWLTLQGEEILVNRMEAFIVNYMALCYNKMGQKEKAIALREKMLCAYENSRVDMKYHYVAVALISRNLADDYEVNGRFEEAIKMCDWAISFALRCKRLSDIGFLYEEKRYAIDRMTGERASGQKVYQQAYQIFKLEKNKKRMTILQNMYQKWYGESLD